MRSKRRFETPEHWLDAQTAWRRRELRRVLLRSPPWTWPRLLLFARRLRERYPQPRRRRLHLASDLLLVLIVAALLAVVLRIAQGQPVPSWADSVGGLASAAALVLLTRRLAVIEEQRDHLDRPILVVRGANVDLVEDAPVPDERHVVTFTLVNLGRRAANVHRAGISLVGPDLDAPLEGLRVVASQEDEWAPPFEEPPARPLVVEPGEALRVQGRFRFWRPDPATRWSGEGYLLVVPTVGEPAVAHVDGVEVM